jgi:hypothetical protein
MGADFGRQTLALRAPLVNVARGDSGAFVVVVES